LEYEEIHRPSRVRRRIQDFILPRGYFGHRVKGMPVVPAYFFHQVEVAAFQRICEGLVSSDFRTVTFGELLDGRVIDGPCVAITLDDGWSSTWSVAYPVARRYGVRFTLFATAEFIEKSEECRPTLDDGVDNCSLVARDFGSRPMLTWGEVRAMHESGVVEVQSHSLTHGVVFTADQLSGFCTPNGPFPLSGHVPLVSRLNSKEVPERYPALGTPLYDWGPALATSRRFIGSPRARERCVQLVEESGGEEFFRDERWENILSTVVDESEAGCWETDEERRERYRNELAQAKSIIEKRLPGHIVRAVAPPWGAMHQELGIIARETGHELIVLAYPFPRGFSKSSILPLYPRLFGDAIWTLIRGPFWGGIEWWRARRQNRRRHAAGAIP
jgi:peptidoglycan/xylan/chitin deacetylase (PgdA/CDA1 family)